MKKILFSILLFPVTLVCYAQSADEQIADAINANDFFLLDERYSELKDEIQTPMLRALSESLLNIVFNRPQQAVKAVDELVINYQEGIGFENVKNMLIWQNTILFRMGEYCDASDRANSFLEQVMPYIDDVVLKSLDADYKYYNSMCGQKKSELVRPGEDCVIPLYIEPVGIKNARKGHIPYVPVTINGKEERFIFDTGCPGGVFLSEEYAQRFGVRVTYDSLRVQGAGGSDWGKMGVLDSIVVGNMTFKNLTVTIVVPNPAVDTVFKVDAVLGTDIMKYAGEVQIFPKEKKIVFPISKTPVPTAGRNMMITSGDGFLVKAYSGGERLIMLLDTGDSAAGLSTSYYHKYKDAIERKGTKTSSLSGGFGGVGMKEYYNIPELPLRIGDKDFVMENINVDIEPSPLVPKQGVEDGSLGMSFINSFDKVIINFDDMFVQVE